MTDALRAMVEAMSAEMVRQTEDADGVRGGTMYETSPGEYTIDARGIDLEKVARAGLMAIVDRDHLLRLDDDLYERCHRIIDAVQGARVPRVEDMASWGESVGAYRQALLGFAEILKETP